MNIENFKRTIQDYLQGKLTERESEQVDRWYQSITEEDINPFHDAAHRHAVKDELFKRLVPTVQAERKSAVRIQRFRWLSAAAAILILGISSLLFLQNHQSALPSRKILAEMQLTQTVTKAGELREIFLPDGTSVFLNGNTQIRYDKINYGKSRAIFLDRGEAFFKVKRDTLHPFTIASGAVSVTVLGTSFNVNRSQASGKVTVEVKTGSVKVSAKKNGEQHTLTRGKAACYSLAKKQFEIFDQNPNTVNLWTQGGMLLSNVGFNALKEIIYNRYGVVLIADNLDTDKFNYSLMIPQVESLDQVLSMICTIHQIKFRREKNEIILHK
ncbi:MAG: FecR family protein [Sphingobacterium sp.]